MHKYSYLIEPKAPLVFRSGRPFGAQSASDDAIFPFPSSAAGLIRAQTLEQVNKRLEDYGKAEEALNNPAYQKLLSLEAQGPFLVRYEDNPEDYTLLVAKPANALYFEDKATGKTLLIRLNPTPYDTDLSGSDLPEGLLPIQMEKVIKGKPQKGVEFWALDDFIKWQAGENLTFEQVESKGSKLPPLEIRTHVALDKDTQAAKQGQLFQTASFDLNYAKNEQGKWNKERLGFLVLTKEELEKNTAVFGGERRLSYFEPLTSSNSLTQPPPEGLLEQINSAKGFSLAFITPCIFGQGYLPSWINAKNFTGILPSTQVEATLKACAIDRWLPVSGWDSILWKPKATRKALSAGSVYWFELTSSLTQEDLNNLWCASFACNEQDKRDGFGTALLAAWQA